MTGRLVVLSGPSGVGKDTVIEAWREADPRVVRVVATSTRAPRPGEVDGVDYDFVDTAEFHRRADAGEFLEFKEVHGNWYATPLATVERLLGEGRIAVLKIDVQGALEVMERRPDAVTVFLMPPSMEDLESRIRGRATDDEATIQRRLANARGEIAQADRYQHRVVNDSVPQAVAGLQEIVGA